MLLILVTIQLLFVALEVKTVIIYLSFAMVTKCLVCLVDLEELFERLRISVSVWMVNLCQLVVFIFNCFESASRLQVKDSVVIQLLGTAELEYC